MSVNQNEAVGLSPQEKRALLAELLRRKAGAAKTFPLSYAQQRLWFLEQMRPGLPVFNITPVVRLEGQLDVPALERTLSEIVHRHEALRTTFTLEEGRPVQRVQAAEKISLPVIDLRGLAEEERAGEAKRLAAEEAQRPFDLERGPLLRITLIRLAEEEHIVVLVLHHIISDGWSMGVLIKELAVLYEAFLEGRESPLPKLPIQYADYSVWQREWLQGDVLKEQLNFWGQQLAGAPALLELPTDRPRPAVQNLRGATLPILFSKSLSAAIKSLSREEGATLFMVLLAAFQILLSRYTGQKDIVVGTPIANRTRLEVKDLIGFFVNTLALRTRIKEGESFRELLGHVREVTLNAYAHQDVPFEKLVEELQPERSTSHQPLFQVMFVMQNAPQGSLKLPGMTISTVPVESGAAQFDLTLSLTEGEESLSGVLEYNAELFEEETVRRMIGHFERLLECIVNNPDEQISRMSLLTTTERQRLLVEWNDTATEFPADRCIHQLFEEWVERTPDSVALVFGDERLTYRQLNERANQLAHHLQRQGVKAETLVGILCERSLEMVIAILGTLKAGGAYVPLDPAYPQARLSFMLEDAGVKVLLTQEHLTKVLPEHNAEVLYLDRDWDRIAQQSSDNPVASVRPENLAYVIYTSGSTGAPKGVLLQHRGVCNLAPAHARIYNVNEKSRVLQFASLSFDASVQEISLALLNGASLCLAKQDDLLSSVNFTSLLRQQGVTVVTLPPSLLLALPPEDLPKLKTVVAAGEACTSEVIERWARSRRFLNGYGPSENTVCATMYLCPPESDGKPPIGRPIANVQVYVLDPQQNPVPIGVPGELHIGGTGLARGYHNRPNLTAEKFIPNPFSDGPGARLYKSGDLARYLPDGNLEFLGRIDHQVKVRGYRIELGEIEAVLSAHEAVREAAVVLKEESSGDKRLAAYVVSREAQGPTANELRIFMKERLPEHMIPALFVMLEEMPLTPNGKVDRRALRERKIERPDLNANFVMPETGTERIIAAVWQEVLQLERVGVHDNFFDLGGHSLLMLNLHSKLKEALDPSITIIDLFEHPTIASLSEHLSRQQSAAPALQTSYNRAETRRALSQQNRRNRQRHQTA